MRITRPALVILSLIVLASCGTSIVVMPIEMPSSRGVRNGAGECQVDRVLVERVVELERELAALRAKHGK